MIAFACPPRVLSRAALTTALALVAMDLSSCGGDDAEHTAGVAEAVSNFLTGWASPEGTEFDATTSYPKRIKRTRDGAVMVLIPAGTFQMGAVPSDEYAYDWERPRHAVTLSKAYYVDETEVTIGMWKKFVTDGGGVLPPGLLPESGDPFPIYMVSWDDAQGFAKRAGVALPTEAQWERAAKGGHDDFVYPWGTSDDEKKRNGAGTADGFDGFAPVKSFASNDYGLFDMSGNVYEWCADAYDRGYYATSPPRDPPGPASAPSRAIRGGSCYGDSRSLRASIRSDSYASRRNGDFGFRCSRSLP